MSTTPYRPDKSEFQLKVFVTDETSGAEEGEQKVVSKKYVQIFSSDFLFQTFHAKSIQSHSNASLYYGAIRYQWLEKTRESLEDAILLHLPIANKFGPN